jgi:beta-glucosidase
MSDFVWGVATSAYQIEGSPRADGAGESIWDRFVTLPGTILHGEDGQVACDHYRRLAEDVRLMADLGVDGYRFSIAWTRVLPDGDGPVNPAGLGFYDRLVDELLAAGITPYPTLYHWDLPQSLQDRGGWPARDTAHAFAAYASVVGEALGDRVTTWMTHNEPWVSTYVGHLYGVFAPGLQDWGAALAAGHHILLSHGLAVEALRAAIPRARVGIALDCRPCAPASDDPADVAAARHFDGFRNRWFFDPVFGRGYPDDVLDTFRTRGRFAGDLPDAVQPGDLDTIAAPTDFVGLNYYTALEIREGADETEDTGVAPGTRAPEGYTEMGWPNRPEALTAFLQRIHAEYAPASIFITENGASYGDGPDATGRIADVRRIAYLRDHLAAVDAARATGVPVEGYFLWSLLDNFEWTSGYSQRFGIVWVDHATGRRLPKDSYHWYRDQIAARA